MLRINSNIRLKLTTVSLLHFHNHQMGHIYYYPHHKAHTSHPNQNIHLGTLPITMEWYALKMILLTQYYTPRRLLILTGTIILRVRSLLILFWERNAHQRMKFRVNGLKRIVTPPNTLLSARKLVVSYKYIFVNLFKD